MVIINLIKPDIVFFTGDLMYKDNKDSTDVANILSKINTELGKYYITGDNDYNDDTVNDILNKSGFNSLDNKYELIYKDKEPILISGISTKKDKTNIEDKLKDTYEYLNNNSNYSILIMHEPNIIDKIEYEKFNLILAGHTKGGVVRIPLLGGIILPEDNYLYGKGYYKKKDTKIYISNGLGNDEVNFRLLNKPSFNFFRLRKK